MTRASYLEAAGFPPEGQVFEVTSLDLAVGDGEHPWLQANRRDIADNWVRESDANPALFDGLMVFQRQLSFERGHIAGQAHMIPFSAFLHWRKQVNAAIGFHLFGVALILSSDGALIAIRMAQNTANPGRVYCAAGSMDMDDLVEGRCDLDLNMRREVLEETGLDLADARADRQHFATHSLNRVSVFRIFRFALTAASIVERVAAHIAADPEPEIAEALAIRDAEPTAHDYAFFMPTVLKWLFSKEMKVRDDVA